ncbi:hypothetical protein RV13_GL002968 [Enterococcus raffinosus]|nr:hypothetical protein RV13_GL002968 [Enterococcus raffinosus]
MDYLLEEYHNQEEKTFATFFIFLLEKSILFKIISQKKELV